MLVALIAMLKIFAQRAIAHDSETGILTFRNIPLGAVVLLAVVLIELFNRRLPIFPYILVVGSAFAFFAASFYLPPKGHSHEVAIVIAYLALLFLVSTALIAPFSSNVRVANILVVPVLISGIATIAGFINTFSNSGRFDGKPEADAAVVLGSSVIGPYTPSPDLKGRLDAAAELYDKDEAKKIAVTGGTRRFGTFESEIGARYLEHIGIPVSAIITEDKTENTIEQVIYAKRHLIGKLKMKRIVIVSDGWHLPRALLMCKWLNVKAEGYASKYKMSFQSELFNRFRESAGLQAYMLFGA